MAVAGKVITQKTIAERLNLHPTTVSMALRNVQLISSETRRRVHQLAEELNYQPNILARNLRTQTSDTIGIIAPSRMWPSVMQARIIAFSQLVHKENLNLMMYYRWSEEPYEKAVRSLRGAQVAALIVSHMNEQTIPIPLREWMEEGRPILFLNHYRRETFNTFNTIDTDRVEGFRQATEYLVRLGHRKPAIVVPQWSGSAPSTTVQIRLDGFRKGLTEAGLPYTPDCVITYRESIEEGMAESMRRLTDDSNPPTALLAYNDDAAAACIQELARLGWKVPKDISVVGFDDSPISRRNLVPITTLAQPVEEMTQITMRKLMELMRGEGPRRFDTILCPPKLIVRETTAPPSNP